MRSSKKFKTGVVLLILNTGFVCGQLNPPIVHNATSATMMIEIEYSDGQVTSGEVPADNVVHTSQPNLEVKRILVTQNGERILEVQDSELARLRPVSSPHGIRWKIDENGISGHAVKSPWAPH